VTTPTPVPASVIAAVQSKAPSDGFGGRIVGRGEPINVTGFAIVMATYSPPRTSMTSPGAAASSAVCSETNVPLPPDGSTT
jgi:hypothetical protein